MDLINDGNCPICACTSETGQVGECDTCAPRTAAQAGAPFQVLDRSDPFLDILLDRLDEPLAIEAGLHKVPMRSSEFYAWRQRQKRETPKSRQLFVSKGTEVNPETGQIRTFTRSAKATAVDMFDTKRCKLSKRQAKKMRKATQREMKDLGYDQLKFNEPNT